MSNPKVVHPTTQNRIDFRNHNLHGPADVLSEDLPELFGQWPRTRPPETGGERRVPLTMPTCSRSRMRRGERGFATRRVKAGRSPADALRLRRYCPDLLEQCKDVEVVATALDLVTFDVHDP